jgi:hypothetical protein
MKSSEPQQLVVWRTSTQLTSFVQRLSNVGKIGSGPEHRTPLTTPESELTTPPSVEITPESVLEAPPVALVPPVEPGFPPAGTAPEPVTPPLVAPPAPTLPDEPDAPPALVEPPVFEPASLSPFWSALVNV